MEYGEAWLLETLAMFCLPVSCLKRSEQAVNDWLNRGYHGLSEEALISTLARLFERGEIDAYSDEKDSPPATRDEFVNGIGDPKCQLYCGVTVAGGQRWERLANPDWNRYFHDVGWDGEYVEITTATRERLDELVANSELLWDCQMSIEENAIKKIRAVGAVRLEDAAMRIGSKSSLSESTVCAQIARQTYSDTPRNVATVLGA